LLCFRSIYIEEDRPLPNAAFRQWIATLLWEDQPDDIWRIKASHYLLHYQRNYFLLRKADRFLFSGPSEQGCVAVDGEAHKFMVQAVHGQYDVQETEVRWRPQEPRRSKIVIIGRHLEHLHDSFRTHCFPRPEQ
jgi:G3E family GTPase